MSNLLIIWELPYTEEKKKLYNNIINTCEGYFTSINSPIETLNFKWTSEERYKRAFDCLKEADVIIAECTKPSSGQWMEIRESVLLWKKLIVIAEKGAKVSGLILASPNLETVIYYSGIKDLKEELVDFLNK